MNKLLTVFNSKINLIAGYVNDNKYFYGLMMIMLNIGSRYLVMDMSSPFHTAVLSSKIFRRIIIFTIIFVATRDLKISFILTACFVILALNLFNDKSKYCILPKSFRNLDTNMDGEISPDEIARAYKVLKKSGKITAEMEKQIKI